jgi:hypothetical protein
MLLGRLWIGYSPNEHIWFFDEESAANVFNRSGHYRAVRTLISSAVNKKYDAFEPSSIVKRIYYHTFMRMFEVFGRGDQLIVILQKNRFANLQAG